MTNRTTNHKEYGIGARVLGGAVAGMIAGAVMAMVAMIRSAAVGLEFWLPPKMIAAVVYGVQSLIEGGGAIFWGLVIHMIVSGAAGMMFGLVAHRMSAVVALVIGLVFGVAIWAFNTWITLPLVNEVMLNRVMIAPNWWFAYHLIFGAMLMFTPALVRSFGRERPVHRREASPEASTRPA